MSTASTFKKYLLVLEEFEKRADKTLDAYDKVLQDVTGLQTKQMGRVLDDDTVLTLFSKVPISK